MLQQTPVWAEVNLQAISENVRNLKNLTAKGTEFMAIVKANAYGHGAVPVALESLKNGATCLGVARVCEGVELREAGIEVPILILGFTVHEDLEKLIKYDLTQTIFNLDSAEALASLAAKSGKKVKVHIKIDTGMGRIGFLPGKNALNEIISIAKLPNLDAEGIYTHFADADNDNKSYTLRQFELFLNFINSLKKNGLCFRYRHAANSAGIIDLPQTHLDLVRAGIAIYGVYPSEKVCKQKVNLIPAMQLKALIAHVKKVPEGTGISYGVTHQTKTEAVIATIPVGYADGYNRLLSSRGNILIRGKRVPIVGRVCMDQFMVDATNLPDVQAGEEVVLMGIQGDEYISADEIALLTNTISYEVFCSISARVPRFHKNPR